MREPENWTGSGGEQTCGWSEALPGEGLPLLPLIQLPHGVIPQGPPLLCRGKVAGGGGPKNPVIHGARHAADALRPHQAVARQRAIPIGVARHDWGMMTGHLPRKSLVRCDAGGESRDTRGQPFLSQVPHFSNSTLMPPGG